MSIHRYGRRTTGPLDARQVDILTRLINGEQQKAIASELGVTQTCVSDNAGVAAAKLGVRTTNAAVARWSVHLTWLKAADAVSRSKVKHPADDAEHHLNHVLDEVAASFRDRAADLAP